MIRCRPIPFDQEGSIPLPAGHLYRFVLLCHGEADEIGVSRLFEDMGFSLEDLVVSSPESWDENPRPRDWPTESPIEPGENETLWRCSGSLVDSSLTVGRDQRIPGCRDTTASIVDAWEYGPISPAARAPTTGAAKEEAQKKHDRSTLVIVGLTALAGFALWTMGERQTRVDAEEERMAEVEERAERARREVRIRELMLGNGHTRPDAEAIAETETWREHVAAEAV